MGEGIFYGIGVGPGDPDLLTLKAVKVLKRVNVVFVPQTSSEKESKASLIAGEYLEKGTPLIPLIFPMTKNKEVLSRCWGDAVEQVKAYLDKDKSAAFLTLGDPMLYSTYIYLFKRIKKEGYIVETVPGVPSFCAAAASAGVPLAEGDEKMALIPWSSEENQVQPLLSSVDSAVLMKVSSDFSGVLKELEKTGLLDNSVMISKCGHEDEELYRLPLDPREQGEKNVSYFSLILARKKGEGNDE